MVGAGAVVEVAAAGAIKDPGGAGVVKCGRSGILNGVGAGMTVVG
jgi:hypothetical protein